MPPSILSAQFEQFAETECRGSSALYYTLAKAIARDESLLAIAAHAGAGQPCPNLFLAAVHYLLSDAQNESLTAFYPDFNSTSRPEADAFPAFKHFVVHRKADIIALLQTRLVQTNEVRRCAYLLPAFQLIARYARGRPLALIEIGTSAGLNLLWDHYRYTYNLESRRWGRTDSPVAIAAEIRGTSRPPLEAAPPSISHRIGFDLKIVDVRDAEQVQWMRALVWPEHGERRALLDVAMSYRGQFQLDLRTGDGFALAPSLLEELPAECVPCVYHTHVANQVPVKTLQRFQGQLTEAGRNRDIVHLHNNIKPLLHLTASFDGQTIDLPLARTDRHGQWFEWLVSSRI